MTSPRVDAPAAVVALLSELVDDAGLFPPAQLDMADAVDAHLTARAGEFRWMLGRFVCPVDRLGELAAVLPTSLDRPVRLSLIGTSASLAATAADSDDDDGSRWSVEAVESRLADDDVGGAASRLVDAARSLGAVRAWLEIPWDELPSDAWPAATTAVADAGAGDVEVGVKVRCGGASAEAVPPPSTLASILVCCRDAGVPLKATAGLHHPFRHPDPATGGMQHGFVNLGVAAALALARGLGAPDVAEVLSDEDDGAFVLGGTVGWRDLTLSADEIADARRRLFAGFGSCSFREPVDDLVALGVLRSVSSSS
jgi:hypothetical protein